MAKREKSEHNVNRKENPVLPCTFFLLRLWSKRRASYYFCNLLFSIKKVEKDNQVNVLDNRGKCNADICSSKPAAVELWPVSNMHSRRKKHAQSRLQGFQMQPRVEKKFVTDKTNDTQQHLAWIRPLSWHTAV